MGKPAALALAEWCAGLDWAAVPPDQHDLLRARLLDTAGLILAGHGTPAGAVLDSYAKRGGSGTSTVLGRAPAPAEFAALIHGTLAHARDFDDTFTDSVVHPGSMIIAAALAVAEAEQSAAEDFAAAIIAGYEVAARIGGVAGRRFHRRGLHATSIVGTFSVVAAIGRLRRHDAATMASAFGLAASMSGGLMAFLGDGAWSKWLHVGWAAHAGIVAMDMAACGFRGPVGALDGQHNLYDAFLHGDEIDLAGLTRDLGRDWQGSAARFKYYPCAHVIQPYIDAVLDLRAKLQGAEVAEIRCIVAPWIVPIVCDPREPRLAPATEMQAIASLYHHVAHAWRHGRVDLDVLGEAARTDPATNALARRVTWRAEAALEAGFPGEVELVLADGSVHRARTEAVAVDMTRLKAKFRANARGHLDGGAQDGFIAALAAPPVPDWRPVAALLASASR